jgi:enamine deaminase RidA (YjgF/YER057c/UK114 family)
VSTSTAQDGFAPAPYRRAGDLLFTGAILPLDHAGELVARGDVAAQARAVFERLQAILAAEGGSLDDVLGLTSFHLDPRTIEAVLDVGREFFPGDAPAWTQVGAIGFARVGSLVTVRAVAHLGEGERKSIIPASQVWREAYPMAAAARKGNLLFIGGQTAAEPDGTIEQPLDHCRQARRCYERMTEILELEGGSIDDVIDFTSFHLDIRGAIPTLEEVYMVDVIGPVPHDRAATTSHVGATGLLRPDLLGAYGAIADLDPSPRVGCTPETITWNDNGRYPIAGASRKQGGRLITVSGQVSAGAHGTLYPGDLTAQLEFIFEEIRDSIAGLGASMSDVVEVYSFHKDPRSWQLVEQVAPRFFDRERPPAWSFVASPGLWLEGYHHEIAAFAVI